jgi:hypothetical protein
MAYDAGYGRMGAGRGYDHSFGPRRGLAEGSGFGGAGTRPRPGGFEGEVDAGEGVFGPARYGLGPYHQRLRKRQRADAEVKTDVEDALFYDTWVDAEAITVEVKDGIVTLRGELPDHDEIRYATDDVWDVEGVRGVRSELRINSARRPPLDRMGQQPGGAGGIGTA